MHTLCRVTTPDGLQLDGSLQRPTPQTSPRNCALLLIHGTGGNFYSGGVLATLADHAVAGGFAVR